nr:hypothetical protein [Lentilactobacillus buchneri]
MATPNVGILTNAGKNLIDQVNAGQTKITFSKIVFSSMNNNQLTDDQIKALTTVAPQEIVVNNPKVTLDNNTGETRIRATGNNEALTDGIYVKTYAVYAKDDSGNEILYGITVSPNPNYLPEYDGVTPQAVTYSYKVNISNTSNITFTNSNDIYVSDTDLAEALQPYAKTVDVNQQLDKKVNVADMRKPASDVAGIEEVNAKQDKIAYTPADDSKVVHSTVTQLNSTDMNTVLTAGFYQSINGTNGIPSGDNWTIYQVVPLSSTHNGVQVAYETNKSVLGIRSWATINGVITFTNWVQFADDSKVAHLSGANNFDTVPTVNNNPLLLANSLPFDLARTGQDQEFTGKNTFDVAPIDKTTGNPYITKDGVPTNYAKDNADGTITANGTVFSLLKSLSASSIPQDPTKDYNTLPQGLALMSEVNGEPANMPPVKSTYLTLTIASSFVGGRKRQLAWLDAGANSSNNNYTYIRYCVGNTWSSWDSIPTSTQITSFISGFYHENADESSAKSAASSATSEGIYWYPES